MGRTSGVSCKFRGKVTLEISGKNHPSKSNSLERSAHRFLKTLESLGGWTTLTGGSQQRCDISLVYNLYTAYTCILIPFFLGPLYLQPCSILLGEHSRDTQAPPHPSAPVDTGDRPRSSEEAALEIRQMTPVPWWTFNTPKSWGCPEVVEVVVVRSSRTTN